MNRGKVRVFSSVLAGFGFLFGKFGRLLHVAWFPGVLFVVAGIIGYELTRTVNIANLTNDEVRGALIYLLEVMTVSSLFQLAMTLVVVVGFYRVALHDYRPRLPIYFRLRNDELRLAGIWFLVLVALYALFMVFVYALIFVIAGYINVAGADASLAIGGGGLTGLFVQLLSSSGSVFAWGYLALSMVILYWVYARLFLAMPAALEHRVTTLGEAWSVSRGNNLRLIFFVILLVVSLVLFTLALNYLVLLAQVVAATLLVAILPPEALDSVAQRSENIQVLIANLPAWGRFLVAGVSQIGVFFVYIFFWGIVIGAASSAFRDIWPGGVMDLTDEEPPITEPGSEDVSGEGV